MYLKSSDLLKAIEDSYSIYWGIILAIPANLDMSSITVIPKVENENRSQIQSKEAVAEIRIKMETCLRFLVMILIFCN